MSNAKPRPVAEINLEEFERRLRASVAPQANVEDPLAELTRLVDTMGFERTASERALEAPRTRAEKPELTLAPIAPALQAPPVPVEPPMLELRAGYAEDLDSEAFAPPAPPTDALDSAPVEVAAAEPPPARPRHWGLKVGGLIIAAAVMAGAVVVLKVGGHGRSGAPPLILASTAPTKVAPPSDATVRTANDSGAYLTHDTAEPTPTPPKLANAAEAPVDLSARPQPSSAPPPATTAATSAQLDMSPIAPSTDTPIVASPAPAPTPAAPISADPSRVKTISVRPDGSLISSGYEDAAPPAPPAPPSPAATVASADAPEAPPPLPTKLSPPKSTARVSRADPTDAAVPAPPPARPKKPKPPVDADAAKVADVEPASDGAEPPPAPTGGYAVQLAAPRSESEAKAMIRSLSSKYGDALGGAALGVRKADRNGETIYRIRAGGLAKAEAAAMCAKVKQAGGDCYVAKN